MRIKCQLWKNEILFYFLESFLRSIRTSFQYSILMRLLKLNWIMFLPQQHQQQQVSLYNLIIFILKLFFSEMHACSEAWKFNRKSTHLFIRLLTWSLLCSLMNAHPVVLRYICWEFLRFIDWTMAKLDCLSYIIYNSFRHRLSWNRRNISCL